jgi:hypothetical protein
MFLYNISYKIWDFLDSYAETVNLEGLNSNMLILMSEWLCENCEMFNDREMFVSL